MNLIEIHWLMRYPWPTEIFMDRGREFMAEVPMLLNIIIMQKGALNLDRPSVLPATLIQRLVGRVDEPSTAKNFKVLKI